MESIATITPGTCITPVYDLAAPVGYPAVSINPFFLFVLAALIAEVICFLVRRNGRPIGGWKRWLIVSANLSAFLAGAATVVLQTIQREHTVECKYWTATAEWAISDQAWELRSLRGGVTGLDLWTVAAFTFVAGIALVVSRWWVTGSQEA